MTPIDLTRPALDAVRRGLANVWRELARTERDPERREWLIGKAEQIEDERDVRWPA